MILSGSEYDPIAILQRIILLNHCHYLYIIKYEQTN
jgi:hypothetical protein